MVSVLPALLILISHFKDPPPSDLNLILCLNKKLIVIFNVFPFQFLKKNIQMKIFMDKITHTGMLSEFKTLNLLINLLI